MGKKSKSLWFWGMQLPGYFEREILELWGGSWQPGLVSASGMLRVGVRARSIIKYIFTAGLGSSDGWEEAMQAVVNAFAILPRRRMGLG